MLIRKVSHFLIGMSLFLIGMVISPSFTFSQNIVNSDARCYKYDFAGRLISISDKSGTTRSYNLDPASNRKSVTSISNLACSSAGVPAPSQPSSGGSSGSGSGSSSNKPPVAVADAASIFVFDTATVWVMSNDTDPDGDSLQIVEAYYDNSKVQVTKVKSVGSSVYNYLDIVGIAPGSTQVQYIVSDGKGGQATGVVNVNVMTSPDPEIGMCGEVMCILN